MAARGRLEAEEVQDLLHRDLATEHVEIDTGHDVLRCHRFASLKTEKRNRYWWASGHGLVFTDAVNKAKSLNDVRYQLGAVQQPPFLLGRLDKLENHGQTGCA